MPILPEPRDRTGRPTCETADAIPMNMKRIRGRSHRHGGGGGGGSGGGGGGGGGGAVPPRGPPAHEPEPRLRLERPGHAAARHRAAIVREIPPARPRCDRLGRPGHGGKLLPACGALLPHPERHEPGAAAAGRCRRSSSGATRTARTRGTRAAAKARATSARAQRPGHATRPRPARAPGPATAAGSASANELCAAARGTTLTGARRRQQARMFRGVPQEGLRDGSPPRPFEPDPGRAGVGTGTAGRRARGDSPGPPHRLRPGLRIGERPDARFRPAAEPVPEVTTGPFPSSRKVHVAGTRHGDLRVAMREIDLSRRRQRAAGARLRHLRPLYRPGRAHRHPHRPARAAPRLDPGARRCRGLSPAATSGPRITG